MLTSLCITLKFFFNAILNQKILIIFYFPKFRRIPRIWLQRNEISIYDLAPECAEAICACWCNESGSAHFTLCQAICSWPFLPPGSWCHLRNQKPSFHWRPPALPRRAASADSKSHPSILMRIIKKRTHTHIYMDEMIKNEIKRQAANSVFIWFIYSYMFHLFSTTALNCSLRFCSIRRDNFSV